MVPDLCTFNVDVRLIPALDDQAALDSIPLVQATYHQALRTLLTPS